MPFKLFGRGGVARWPLNAACSCICCTVRPEQPTACLSSCLAENVLQGSHWLQPGIAQPYSCCCPYSIMCKQPGTNLAPDNMLSQLCQPAATALPDTAASAADATRMRQPNNHCELAAAQLMWKLMLSNLDMRLHLPQTSFLARPKLVRSKS